MLFFPLEVLLTKPQFTAWQAVIAECGTLEDDPDDPWVFHGTTALRGAWVEQDGFRQSYVGARDGVHWGSIAIARQFAERSVAHDDHPVIFAARLSHVLASGHPVPDMAMVETPMGQPFPVVRREWTDDFQAESWRDTYEMCGAFAVLNCRSVEGLRAIGILRDLPLHPDAPRRREWRLEDALRPQPWQLAVAPHMALPQNPVFAGPDDLVEFEPFGRVPPENQDAPVPSM